MSAFTTIILCYSVGLNQYNKIKKRNMIIAREGKFIIRKK